MKWLLFLATSLFAYNENQVFSIADMYGDNPSTVLAIAKVESGLGKHKGRHEAKGIMQIKPITARFMAEKYPQLRWIKKTSDRQLNYVLQHNDGINIMIGSLYFDYLFKHKRTYKQAVSSYNACKTDKYYNKVRSEL